MAHVPNVTRYDDHLAIETGEETALWLDFADAQELARRILYQLERSAPALLLPPAVRLSSTLHATPSVGQLIVNGQPSADGIVRAGDKIAVQPPPEGVTGAITIRFRPVAEPEP